MKKIIALVGLVGIMFSFVACGNGKCDNCGREGDIKKYTIEGQSANLCSECGSIIDALQSLTK